MEWRGTSAQRFRVQTAIAVRRPTHVIFCRHAPDFNVHPAEPRSPVRRLVEYVPHVVRQQVQFVREVAVRPCEFEQLGQAVAETLEYCLVEAWVSQIKNSGNSFLIEWVTPLTRVWSLIKARRDSGVSLNKSESTPPPSRSYNACPLAFKYGSRICQDVQMASIKV